MSETQKIPWKRLAVEATAIVVSILLAFWIDAWWDGRVEQDNLLGYLTALEQELSESRKDIESNLNLSVAVLGKVDSIFSFLADSGRENLPDSFAETIGSVYKIHTPVLTTGAYEDIVSSGNLRLIRNRTLNVRIVQYMQVISSVRTVNQVLWDTYYDLQVPFLKEHFVISDFGWESAEEIADAGGLLSLTPKGPYSIHVDAIRTQAYWNLLYSWKEAYADQVRQMVVAKMHCDEILEMLRPEIERLQQ